MLEKPDLPDEAIRTCLREYYGLRVTQLEFLPLGYDSRAGVYRVEAEYGGAYFLKVRRGPVNPACLALPYYLKMHGLPQVIAPLPAQGQVLWQRVGDYALILYPFVEGNSGMVTGLSDGQWVQFGRLARQIHTTYLPPALSAQVKREDFIPKWGATVRRLADRLRDSAGRDAYERQLAGFWEPRRAEIRQIVARAAALGRQLLESRPGFCLCHADMHTANLLIDREGRMFVVDWDETLLAPRERDLMFVVGAGLTRSKEERLFFEGYGRTAIDPLGLAYYRYEWVVQEIGEFGQLVCLDDQAGEQTRRAALRDFKQLFQPGDVVEAAYRSEQGLAV